MYVCTIICFVINKKASWFTTWHEDCIALFHTESDTKIAIECILGSLESSDHVTVSLSVHCIRFFCPFCYVK